MVANEFSAKGAASCQPWPAAWEPGPGKRGRAESPIHPARPSSPLDRAFSHPPVSGPTAWAVGPIGVRIRISLPPNACGFRKRRAGRPDLPGRGLGAQGSQSALPAVRAEPPYPTCGTSAGCFELIWVPLFYPDAYGPLPQTEMECAFGAERRSSFNKARTARLVGSRWPVFPSKNSAVRRSGINGRRCGSPWAGRSLRGGWRTSSRRCRKACRL